MSTASNEAIVKAKNPLKGNTRLIDLENMFNISIPSSWETEKNINDVINDEGFTPLTCALRYQDKLWVKVLLECDDIDPNQEDQKGTTPLMMAYVYMGEALDALLLKGAKFEKKSTYDFYDDSVDLQGMPTLPMTVMESRVFYRNMMVNDHDNIDLLYEYVWFATMPAITEGSNSLAIDNKNPFVTQTCKITKLDASSLQQLGKTMRNSYPQEILKIIGDYIPHYDFYALYNPKLSRERKVIHQENVHKAGKANFEKRASLIQKQRMEQEKLKEQENAHTMLVSLSTQVATLTDTVTAQAQQIELLTKLLQTQQQWLRMLLKLLCIVQKRMGIMRLQ